MVAVYIRNSIFGWKKILFLYVIVLVFFLGEGGIMKTFPWFSANLFLGVTLCLFLLSYKNGICVVQHTFKISGREYQVRDVIFPGNSKKSFRAIFSPKDQLTHSALFLSPQEGWAYLDCIREWIQENKKTNGKMLVFGGAGNGVALEAASFFGYETVTIELSKKMKHIAVRYFHPLRKKGGVRTRILRGDALTFRFQRQEKFDCIVIDIFQNNGALVKEISNDSFIKKIASHGEYVIVNFGVGEKTPNFHLHFSQYKNSFQHSHIYQYHHNYIGIFSNSQKIRGKISGIRII